MSEFHQYADSFASRFGADEFNFLSPGKQEHQGNKDTESQGSGTATVSGGESMAHEGVVSGESYEGGSTNEERSRGEIASQSSTVDSKKVSKPKRTRATGETLDILKQEFEVNPNPTTQRRKKISELTGLPEKNVRIWFQNRRAKLRKSGGQHKSGADNSTDSGAAPMMRDDSHDCATYFDRIPVNINNNYYFIDVCSITVGSWNRMKSGALRRENLPLIRDLSNLSPISINHIMSNATDLMVLISKKNFEINYFFSAMANNTKILFRIFFSLGSVVNCSLTLETGDITEGGTRRESDENHDHNESNDTDKDCNQSESFAELKLAVSRPPNFAVFFLDNSEEGNGNQWSICEDFSEGRQVNDAFVGGSNMPHALKGSESSLKFMNSLILDYNSANQILPPPPTHLHNPSMAGQQSLALHEHPQTFFDQYDAANDILALNRDTSAIDEKNRLSDNNNANSLNQNQAENSATLLSLSHDSHIPNMPDFFKNTQELTDDHRWL
ncbi:hypothetical protein HG536_0A02660 [Torulaspora globosa]|uniref:Homeobox domain-containing protein n=1 Tax=Torulaspora globosa TaxID=48254 RepID=A0A7G3ZAB3_9SACH|nr:uncharacterized protein HG536_0A02660 [Torulaspora globosa]QLL30449.1 hypothetical protein HG536_0A02660 [Torulaspora globosa]